ncbi:Predicted CoA-binding protein (YccU) (PDB:1IUK) [Commensalibacter communis]|uniref:Predicted CoA-binding protein (YccU) n=1 Tax=Commensalibacter communis TaxID=2972786 RepID=A0A9W4TN85_9PROT|nr:CoA-binding protein [Commensalibacter communis]CAI3928877.1 Predicted CoA-binding protein (YccU) (PDB:1IUK) [Commensalibacter communis]CAI3929451.1 Predicted CoA-binding protein (YccU) (PDB:1IUK) [Commensalibacter communis]CAI3932004.1 Predicted CoA-binding protein (YccU) (PDB:1IUK) [Commensalibacter communis]CAI3933547.1 Predicted CoA-binding protein (YccU) (PDB:1IUK) [Commensalibacter communis]
MAKILTSRFDILSALSQVKTIALIGASNKPDRPSYGVMKSLLGYGFNVIPVNPILAGKMILGQTVYATLSDIDASIDMVEIFRNAEAVPAIVDEILGLKMTHKLIWMQLNIIHEVAAKRAVDAGIDVVMDRCPVIELGLHG